MSDLIGGAMALYFGTPASDMTIEDKLNRDIAALERSIQSARGSHDKKSRKSKSRKSQKSQTKRARKKRRKKCTLKMRR